MSVRLALVALLVVWGLGAAFLPLGGLVHVLLVAAAILVLLDRIGRTG